MVSIHQVLLNRFRVEAYLGSGAIGTVYRVWDMQRNVPLAMKVLHADLVEDPQSLQLFLAEARTLKELAHPSIVPFYGLYQTTEATFLVEGYIDGFSLKDVLLKQFGKPLQHEEIIHDFKAICAALQYAHARGIIHYDIKPGNILRDQRGQVYLADFSIARYLGPGTDAGASAGTPAYMAPEQIRRELLTPQTDIYALGVMLFEVLTGGHRPFTGAQAEIDGTNQEKILWEHLHRPPPSPQTYNPSISAQLERVVLHCLEKDPRRRYASPIEMFNDLAQAAAALPDLHQKPVKHGNTIIEKEGSQRKLEWANPLVRLRPGVRLLLAAGFVLIVFFTTFAFPRPLISEPGPALSLPTVASNQPVLKRPKTMPQRSLPTLTPTLQSNFDVLACMTVLLDAQNSVEECVTGITLQPDGKMRFDFSWAAALQPNYEVEISSSLGNKSMFLTDDLDNRYIPLQVGGDASRTIKLRNGETAKGWFLFPSPASEVKYFIFHDDDNLIETQAIRKMWP